MNTTTWQSDKLNLAALILTGIALLLVLQLHLLPALLTGLLVYESVHVLTPLIPRRLMSGSRARVLTVAVLATIIIGLITLMILGVVSFFRAGSTTVLIQKLAEIIEGSRDKLPLWVVTYLPDSTEELRAVAVAWLREHAGTLQVAGKELGRGMAHVLIGMVVGALLSLSEGGPIPRRQPLAYALAERAERLAASFRRIVLAQAWISGLNTFFTWLYLGVALPLFGVELPFIKTLIVLTFIAGLLPVIGNLISNTAIFIVSLSFSLPVAICSLGYLVVIHKLEYFLNARIIGARIHARAWELLIAMLVMEAAFGFAGLIAAPIYYAYIKDELGATGLV